MPDFEEKALCRKAGGILELSAKKGYEPIAFTKLWLRSKTAQNLYEWDFHDVAQSKQYLFRSVEMEYELKPEDRCQEGGQWTDEMYWGGYTFMYLSFEMRLKPKDILKIYDIERILKCYDTLHTLSEKAAVEEIKTQFLYQASC